jgi:hypothetical protein
VHCIPRANTLARRAFNPEMSSGVMTDEPYRLGCVAISALASSRRGDALDETRRSAP